MNMRSIMVLGAISAIGLAACVVTTGPSGGVGGGGVGGEGLGGGGVGGGGGGEGGAAAGCVMGTHCGAVISNDGEPSDICDGTEAAGLYDAYFACLCTTKCATPCASFMCGKAGGTETECQSCVTANCQKELEACSADL